MRTSRETTPQLEVNVYKNHIPLCAVLIGIVEIRIYMLQSHSVGVQSKRKPELKRAAMEKTRCRPV